MDTWSNIGRIYGTTNIGKLQTKLDYAAQSPSFWSSDQVLVVREIQDQKSGHNDRAKVAWIVQGGPMT